MYNEPTDSPYFRHGTLASVPAHLNNGMQCIIVGDLNSRLGHPVQSLVEQHDDMVYNVIDPIQNVNGRSLLDICKSNTLFPVNNLQCDNVLWQSQLTYRQGVRWISEVDLCVISQKLIKSVTSFSVNQNIKMPSDHALMSIKFDFSRSNNVALSHLIERSSLLGLYPQPSKSQLCRKPVHFRHIDHVTFIRKMEHCLPPASVNDVLKDLEVLTNTLYESSIECKKKPDEPAYSRPDKSKNRWQRMLEVGDSRTLWRGIDWKGNYRETEEKECPPEAAFQQHIERLLNPDNVEPLNNQHLDAQPTVATLDGLFSLDELLHVRDKQMQPEKGCGPDGTSPGVIKLLPIAWIMFLLTVINALFVSGIYPLSWASSKLIMLYKKGPVMTCGNYRGISVMNCLAKLYDYLLNNRLMAWYSLCREQAGAQQKRGCIEHIVSLRLIIDRSVRKRSPLFIAFIDFSKAYDRVPRNYLLNLLKHLGCGVVMLTALTSMYWLTQFILGATVITAVLGVKQGSPTSCFLFILFVDEFVRLVKGRSMSDGFLDWLHLLVLMDDTVILATSRERLQEKLDMLVEWCDVSGMVINEDKTKFMAFCSPAGEKCNIVLTPQAGRVIVTHCSEYTYLGSIFTSDGSVRSALAKHVDSRKKAMNKLIIFLDKNKNAPYEVKKAVVDACFNTSLLYGCEAWLGVKPICEIKSMYMKGIKLLLGVRHSTTNDVCLIEAGFPSLESLVRSRQKAFFEKMIEDRTGLTDDPLMFAIDLTHRQNPVMSRYIRTLLDEDNIITSDIEMRKHKITNSTQSKLVTYFQINPTLSVHPMYKINSMMEDDLRVVFTRFRVSSHRLKVETGRWSRIPRESRLCQCEVAVQTEEHVLCVCTLVQHIRIKFGAGVINFSDFVSTVKSKKELTLLKEIMEFVER